MNENKYQKLAELIGKAPRLLGPGGLFGGLNQEHTLMADFIKFAKALKISKNMSPETINIRNFVAYLGDRKNAEKIGRKLYDMRQDGEIVDDPHIKEKNTLFNLAETLFDLGVGEKPENVGGDYEGVLMETLTRAGVSSKGERRLPGEEVGKVKEKGATSVPKNVGKAASQGDQPKGERPRTSPETSLSTMGEDLTDEVSIVQGEETQVGALASASAIGAEMQAAQLNLAQEYSVPGDRAAASRSEAEAPGEAKAQEPKIEGAAPAPGREVASPETPLSTMPSDRDSGLLRLLTAPVTGQSAGSRATGEALVGTRSAPGGERRHIAELPGGGRMLRKGSKKQSQRENQGAGESRPDQGRQATSGRNPAQDFANLQSAQPKPRGKAGRRVAGGAGVAGTLALMKGMYGGAAANAATFGVLQTILDLLT